MLEATAQISKPTEMQKAETPLVNVARSDVTIVLPVLNEEEGIAAVLDELHENGYTNVLVVDGYSTDMTVEAARKRGATVIEQHGRGKTGAIQTAVENVTTPYMLIMDGDFTYDTENVERFLRHVNGYDQIVGIRSPENISRLHRVGNRLISGLFNTVLNTNISDVCSGMYLLNTGSARDLEFHTKGFSVEVEILAQMALRGKVTEVPIHYRKRIGKPKLSTVIHGFDITKSILGLARRYNPVFLFSLVAGLAGIPGAAILGWVLWDWSVHGVMHAGWAIAGGMLLLFAAQAFVVGTVALLLKRTEFRLEQLVASRNQTQSTSSKRSLWLA